MRIQRLCVTSEKSPGASQQIVTWSKKTNAKQRGVDWQFRIENARVKLKRLDLKIKTWRGTSSR